MANSIDRPSKQISRAEMRDALLRSGYLAENRVADLLRSADWYVVQNTAYPDPSTGRSRESDIYARDLSEALFGSSGGNSVWAECLIECVNPPNPLVFFAPKEPEQFEDSAWLHCMRILGAPLHVPTTDVAQNWRELLPHLDLEGKHHYTQSPVTTQFCSFERKKDKEGAWFATHREMDHEALVSLCHATEHFTRNFYRTDGVDRDPEAITICLLYSVVVVSGQLFQATATTRSVQLKAVPHIKYCRTLVDGGQPHTYMIDVVSESYFRRFVDMLRKDVDAVATSMGARWPALAGIIAVHQEVYEDGIKAGSWPRPPLIP